MPSLWGYYGENCNGWPQLRDKDVRLVYERLPGVRKVPTAEIQTLFYIYIYIYIFKYSLHTFGPLSGSMVRPPESQEDSERYKHKRGGMAKRYQRASLEGHHPPLKENSPPPICQSSFRTACTDLGTYTRERRGRLARSIA